MAMDKVKKNNHGDWKEASKQEKNVANEKMTQSEIILTRKNMKELKFKMKATKIMRST